jgi:hypothetical protein
MIALLDENFTEIARELYDFGIVSNLVYHDGTLSALNWNTTNGGPIIYDNINSLYIRFLDPRPYIMSDDTKNPSYHLYQGNFLGDENAYYFIHYQDDLVNKYFLQTKKYSNDSLDDFGSFFIQKDFPFPFKPTGQILFKDTNNKGRSDLVLSHANGFRVYSMNEVLLNDYRIDNPQHFEGTGGGMLAWNWKNDDDAFYIGTFSRGRLLFFDSSFNEIKRKRKSLSRPINSLPYITMQSDSVYIYQSIDNGRLYDIYLKEAVNIENLKWSLKQGNYFRHGFWSDENMFNAFISNRIFIKNECFVYPNPFLKKYHNELIFHIVTSKETVVNLKLYTISGQLVAQKSALTYGGEPNKSSFNFDVSKLSAGVYFAIAKADGEDISFKFAIER